MALGRHCCPNPNRHLSPVCHAATDRVLFRCLHRVLCSGMGSCPAQGGESWPFSQDKSKTNRVPQASCQGLVPMSMWSNPGEWDLGEFCWGAPRKVVLPNLKECTGRKPLFFGKHGLVGTRWLTLLQPFVSTTDGLLACWRWQTEQFQTPRSLMTRLIC